MKTRSKIVGLLDEIIKERIERLDLSDERTEVELIRLRHRFAQVHAEGARVAAAQVRRAIGQLPAERRAGWLEGVLAGVRIVLSEAGKSSKILLDPTRDVLPQNAGGWDYGYRTAELNRSDGEPDTSIAVSLAPDGASPSLIRVDDDEGYRRVEAEIRDFPADQAPPVLLVTGIDENEVFVREVDAQIFSAKGNLRDLLYETYLPVGSYRVFLGNPRTGSN